MVAGSDPRGRAGTGGAPAGVELGARLVAPVVRRLADGRPGSRDQKELRGRASHGNRGRAPDRPAPRGRERAHDVSTLAARPRSRCHCSHRRSSAMGSNATSSGASAARARSPRGCLRDRSRCSSPTGRHRSGPRTTWAPPMGLRSESARRRPSFRASPATARRSPPRAGGGTAAPTRTCCPGSSRSPSSSARPASREPGCGGAGRIAPRRPRSHLAPAASFFSTLASQRLMALTDRDRSPWPFAAYRIALGAAIVTGLRRG